MGNPKYESQRIQEKREKHQYYSIEFPDNIFRFYNNENERVSSFRVHLSKPLTVAEIKNRVDKILNRG